MINPCFQPFPTLQTGNLLLRQLQATDAEAFFALRSDVRVMRYLNRPVAQSIDDALKLLQVMETALARNHGITWAIAQKADPTLIGTIGFWRIEAENHRAEIGYLLHPHYQGRGWMDAALKQAIQYGFEQIGLHSIEANIDPRNAPSARLLERNGFVREAYFKENIYANGQYSDTAIYSLLNPAP